MGVAGPSWALTLPVKTALMRLGLFVGLLLSAGCVSHAGGSAHFSSPNYYPQPYYGWRKPPPPSPSWRYVPPPRPYYYDNHRKRDFGRHDFGRRDHHRRDHDRRDHDRGWRR